MREREKVEKNTTESCMSVNPQVNTFFFLKLETPPPKKKKNKLTNKQKIRREKKKKKTAEKSPNFFVPQCAIGVLKNY